VPLDSRFKYPTNDRKQVHLQDNWRVFSCNDSFYEIPFINQEELFFYIFIVSLLITHFTCSAVSTFSVATVLDDQGVDVSVSIEVRIFSSPHSQNWF
jgi:hypothetical protein